MTFRCGDVVWADLDPAVGHEQRKRRPLIVVSNDSFNERCSLTVTIPITSAGTGYPLHLDVGKVPTENGESPVRGFAQIEQLKSLDLTYRNGVKVGTINATGMDKILSLILGCLITPDMMVVNAR